MLKFLQNAMDSIFTTSFVFKNKQPENFEQIINKNICSEATF